MLQSYFLKYYEGFPPLGGARVLQVVLRGRILRSEGPFSSFCCLNQNNQKVCSLLQKQCDVSCIEQWYTYEGQLTSALTVVYCVSLFSIIDILRCFCSCRFCLWRVRTWWASHWPTVESLTWSSKTAPRWCSFMVTDRWGLWYLITHIHVFLSFLFALLIWINMYNNFQLKSCRRRRNGLLESFLLWLSLFHKF